MLAHCGLDFGDAAVEVSWTNYGTPHLILAAPAPWAQ